MAIMRNAPKCRSCGRLLSTHPGLPNLCLKLQAARAALNTIKLWCEFYPPIGFPVDGVRLLVIETQLKIGSNESCP